MRPHAKLYGKLHTERVIRGPELFPKLASDLVDLKVDLIVTRGTRAVAARAGTFAAEFGWAEVARLAGLLHDIGKCSSEFFAYINRSSAGEERLRGPDHSTAGAKVAEKAYPFPFGPPLPAQLCGSKSGTPWDSPARS